MPHIKGITNLSCEKNPDYMEPWLRLIGSYMLNFGAIELLSYQYLDHFELTEDDFFKNTNKLLGSRISRILELVKESGDINAAEIIDVWEHVRELSKWRNRIAHNPVLPTWKPGSDPQKSPPDVLGVSDMRQVTKENRVTDSISLKGLGLLNDHTVEIAEKLSELMAGLKNS